MSYNDIDSPDYRDTNLGDYRMSPDEKEIERLTEALETTRRQRDVAEADRTQLAEMLNAAKGDVFEKLHNVGLHEIAAKAARELPPDVLASPMPFPGRIDYAEAVIGRAILEAIKTVKS